MRLTEERRKEIAQRINRLGLQSILDNVDLVTLLSDDLPDLWIALAEAERERDARGKLLADAIRQGRELEANPRIIELVKENACLRAALAEVEQERDNLKRFLAGESHLVTDVHVSPSILAERLLFAESCLRTLEEENARLRAVYKHLRPYIGEMARRDGALDILDAAVAGQDDGRYLTPEQVRQVREAMGRVLTQGTVVHGYVGTDEESGESRPVWFESNKDLPDGRFADQLRAFLLPPLSLEDYRKLQAALSHLGGGEEK